MTRRPVDRDWRLTVRAGALVLDAPHGTFAVRGLERDVQREVATYPDDVVVVCRGDYEDGANISCLIVTRITSVATELVPVAPSDAAVRASPDAARARAAERLGVGDVDGAVDDLELALEGNANFADEVFAVLPEDTRARLGAAFAKWTSRRKPEWRTLRWVPLARWSDEHVQAALLSAASRAGRFGELTGEQLVAELQGRRIEHARDAKKLAKLRRARATEGGTAFRIETPLHDPTVVGATRDTVWVAGKLDAGPAPIVPPGALRQIAGALRPAVIAYDTDGNERARYVDVVADRVFDGVAVQLYLRANARWQPHVRRLADNTVLCEFREAVLEYDDREVTGPIDKTRAEVRRIATGELVRERRIANVETIPTVVKTVRAPDGKRFEVRSNDESRFQGWYLFHGTKRVYVGPTDGELVVLEPARSWHVDGLVPPWLVFEQHDAFVLVALGELMTCQAVRVDGKLVAKRVKAN